MTIWDFLDKHFIWFMIYTAAVWLIPAFWVLGQYPTSEKDSDE